MLLLLVSLTSEWTSKTIFDGGGVHYIWCGGPFARCLILLLHNWRCNWQLRTFWLLCFWIVVAVTWSVAFTRCCWCRRPFLFHHTRCGFPAFLVLLLLLWCPSVFPSTTFWVDFLFVVFLPCMVVEFMKWRLPNDRVFPKYSKGVIGLD